MFLKETHVNGKLFLRIYQVCVDLIGACAQTPVKLVYTW